MIESLLALFVGLVAAYGIVCLYAYFFADSFIFTATAPTYQLRGDYTATTADNGDSISLLYLPSPGARYTILYSHGQEEDIGFIRPRLEILRAKGYNVLSYDYPGYGTSVGRKSEEGFYSAATAAYRYLTDVQKIPPQQIILYGRSLGGGPTAYLASRYMVGGVIMHSTFVSAFRVQTGIRILPWDRFDNLSRIGRITAPIFFVHGLSDEVIPAWHSQMLYEAATAPKMKLLVPHALHNNVIEVERENFWSSMSAFTQMIDAHHSPPPAAPLSPTS